MKTRDEVENLKESWKKDPIWDIAKTEGFEEYSQELSLFQDSMRMKWDTELEEKRNYNLSKEAFDDWLELASAKTVDNYEFLALANAVNRQAIALEGILNILERWWHNRI